MMAQPSPADEPMPDQVQTAPAPQHISGPWSFELAEALCRQPGLSANDRASHFIRNRSVQAVREAVTYKVRSLINRRRMPAHLTKVRVDVAWHVDDHRDRDPNNLHPLSKAICDAIGSNKGTGAHLTKDDSPAYMEQPTPTIIRRPGQTPGFTVTITNLGDLP